MSNLKNNSFLYLRTTHQFHLVDPSPWPLLAALGGFMLTTGLVSYMHKFLGGWILLVSGFIVVLFVMYVWWRDIVSSSAIKTFFNNTITLSSFLITPPTSLSKISMLSWVATQYDESIFIICCILAWVFMFGVAQIGFLIIYVVYKKDTFFVNEVLPHFKKLSLFRKVLFGSFTVFTAIPNKFWINVNIHFVVLCTLSAILYFLFSIFPFLFFCYWMYLMLCLESFIFGLLYEYSEYYKKIINFMLFGNSDEPFAADYFYWFWGNMFRQAGKKAAPLITTVVALEAKRQQENQQKNDYANLQTAEAAATKQGFQNPTERAGFHTDRRNEWVQENGAVTKFMKFVEDASSGGP